MSKLSRNGSSSLFSSNLPGLILKPLAFSFYLIVKPSNKPVRAGKRVDRNNRHEKERKYYSNYPLPPNGRSLNMSNFQAYNSYNQEGGDYNSGGFDSNGAGSSQGNRTQQKSSLTPVTIKEIIDSKTQVQDGDFVVHGIELNQVSFVGVIRNVIDNTSSLQIQVEDGTGSLEIRKWNDENAPSDSAGILVPNKYVYITGSVKEFSGKKNIQHATFREITDYNEVIYHQLSAIDAYFTSKGLLSTGRSKTDHKEGLFVSGPSEGESKGTVSDRIFEFIQENTPSMPEGVPTQLVAQSLGLLVDDVVLHCGKLTEDGKIYAGYDEHGYLAI